MAPEVVAVPTRGMERWLTQRLSASLGATAGRSDGVCANIAFPWPRRVVGDAVAAASGVDPERDPWLPERATWPLLDVLEASLGEPWLDAVAAHLGADSDQPDPVRRARRLSVVRHAAELFDRYALNRPEMIRAWATGDDTDGAGGSLPPMSLWQAELWRRLRLRIGIPGPAERLDPACARLRDDASVVDLPATALAVRADPAPRGTPARPAGDRRHSGRPPVPAAPLPRVVGRDRRDEPERTPAAAPRRRPHDRAAVQPAARLLGPGRPRDAARARLRRRPRRPSSPRSSPATARFCSASRLTSGPTVSLRDRRSPVHRTTASSSTRQTAASRSTRATAAHARSR